MMFNTYRVLYDTDTPYGRYQIIEEQEQGRSLRILKMGGAGAQSGVYVDNPDELAFEYTQRFMEAARGVRPATVLMIGGGALTVPRALRDDLPALHVDVVEIDPRLAELAERFFFYRPDPRISIMHQDGRIMLDNNQKRYDVIFVDAFSSLTPPPQLTTQEAARRIAASLSETGIAVVNMVTPYEGDAAGFLTSEYLTYDSVFPAVVLVQAKAGLPLEMQQNLLLVAGSDWPTVRQAVDSMRGQQLHAPATDEALVLTDAHAPVAELLGF